VYSGTHTLKVVVSITKPGKVYYVVSDKQLEGITGPEVKEIATAQKNEHNEYGKNILSGVVDIGQSKANDTASFQLKVPTDSRNYFTYFIAESQENDSAFFFIDGGKI